MGGHFATNRAIYVDAIEARINSGNVDFCTAIALDFGLHGSGQIALIDEINGNYLMMCASIHTLSLIHI